MAKQYRRPRNDFVNSDDAYWYLREVDHLLEVPACGPSRLEVMQLDGAGGAPLRVADMCMLQLERERLVVLEAGGRCLHLYSGGDLRPSLRIELKEPACRVAASSRSFYLLAGNASTVSRIRLPALAGAITTSEGREEVISLGALPLETHRLPSEFHGRGDLLFVATPTHGPKPPERLLLSTQDLREMYSVVASEHALLGSRFELAGPKTILRAPRITAACAASDGSVFLFNEPTGHVLSFSPASVRPTVRVVAGDGVTARGHDQHFARSLEARLQPLSSLCEFRVSGRILSELAELARFSPSADYSQATTKIASRSPKSIGPQIRSLIEQGSFLLGYCRAGGVSTISAPTAIERLREMADGPGPRVMPLRLPGAQARRAGVAESPGGASADAPTAGWDGCILGPESSVLFWRRDAWELLCLEIDFGAFDALRRDAAFLEELNTRKGQVGRMGDFSDS